MKKQYILVFMLFFSTLVFSTEMVDTAKTVAAAIPAHAPVVSAFEDWNFLPGDAILITVTPDTGFPNGIYPVGGDGFVDLPMLGPLQVTAMSKADFEEKVKEKYIPLLRFSSVHVRRVISISFQGGFQRPGVYWVSPGASLWYAISLSGGPVREDGFKRVKWERDGKKMDQKVSELLKVSQPISSLGVRSGDVMRVINRPKKTGWDVFRQDVLPLISIALSSAVTTITLYEWSQRR